MPRLTVSRPKVELEAVQGVVGEVEIQKPLQKQPITRPDRVTSKGPRGSLDAQHCALGDAETFRSDESLLRHL